jgi:hypothetical protein
MAANQYGRAIAALGEALSWLSASAESLENALPNVQPSDVVSSHLDDVEAANARAFKLIRKALKHIAET